MVFERPQCVALDGFTMHAATRASGLDDQGREAPQRGSADYFTAIATIWRSKAVVRSVSGFERYPTNRSFDGTLTMIALTPSGEIAPLCQA